MTKNASTQPRALDHLVLPVRFLDVARARYEQLGFTVAPDGVHPFGTENCCVFFADETMIEPLAIAHRETCEAAALAGNTFVRNDQTFRFRRGDEGFSHVVLKTNDAAADDVAFNTDARSGGALVEFSRPLERPDGSAGKVDVSLAFATDPRAPDAYFFTCEDRSTEGDKSALVIHANGATGLVDVVATEPNPSDFQYFLQELANQRELESDSFGISVALDGSTITVLTPDGMNALYAAPVERSERGLRFAGFVVGVTSLDAVHAHLAGGGITFHERLDKIIVPPAPGQGCTIAFQEVAA